jgi:hypothetical protein
MVRVRVDPLPLAQPRQRRRAVGLRLNSFRPMEILIIPFFPPVRGEGGKASRLDLPLRVSSTTRCCCCSLEMGRGRRTNGMGGWRSS